MQHLEKTFKFAIHMQHLEKTIKFAIHMQHLEGPGLISREVRRDQNTDLKIGLSRGNAFFDEVLVLTISD